MNPVIPDTLYCNPDPGVGRPRIAGPVHIPVFVCRIILPAATLSQHPARRKIAVLIPGLQGRRCDKGNVK